MLLRSLAVLREYVFSGAEDDPASEDAEELVFVLVLVLVLVVLSDAVTVCVAKVPPS